MRLTSFTDYGLRMLMLIAGHDRPLSTAELADELGLSRHHLAKIMQRLSQAGIVETRRGGNGGAVLALPASEIRLGSVIAVLESDQPIVDCFGTAHPCSIHGRCGLKARLRRAEAAFLSEMDSASLADIALAPAGGPA